MLIYDCLNCWIFIFLVPKTHIDDEYANATERDPKILLTTSRDPSAPLVQFVKVGLSILVINNISPLYYACKFDHKF